MGKWRGIRKVKEVLGKRIVCLGEIMRKRNGEVIRCLGQSSGDIGD